MANSTIERSRHPRPSTDDVLSDLSSNTVYKTGSYDGIPSTRAERRYLKRSHNRHNSCRPFQV
ncbi:hypothetical protein P5673_030075 [Acropora cervicornis]|uniref:Uncharacterized protein n=1 Tax=Acropora cervicornis TaxID=6130 RepID=A0AAD9PUM3_ACRCE|nr:hypothetical protein P5673_030075 [Acropora cervicornis]